MKYTTIALLIAFSTAILVAGCDSLTDEGGEAILAGQVVNRNTNNPIPGVLVQVQNREPSISQLTDVQGRFSLEVPLDSIDYVDILAFREGFVQETLRVLAVPKRSVDVPPLKLAPVASEQDPDDPGEDDPDDPGDPSTSGKPARIVLADLSAKEISVRETGGEEISAVTFVVQDSTGRAIGSDNSLSVRFEFGGRPNGGEELFPSETKTNSSGIATVNIMSGTTSGVVQVIATAQYDGQTLKSEPVTITIHSGLPDANHFSVVPERLNFPGLLFSGLENPITAFVGDKYANPVRPQTPVYYTTDGGIIEATATTDNMSRATAVLLSAIPHPADGFATIEARTTGENGTNISTTTTVLFSGGVVPIAISPSSLPGQLPQGYTFYLHDENQNPLAAGTTITVSADGTNINAVGDTNVTLDDTQARGRGTTEFRFSIVQGDGEDGPEVKSITINVAGPNGRASLTVTGDGVLNIVDEPEDISSLRRYGFLK